MFSRTVSIPITISSCICHTHTRFSHTTTTAVISTECWNIRSQDYSFPGTFVPMMELSFSGPFVPWNFRSQDYSFPGTFVLWTVRFLDHSFPRTNKHCRPFPPSTRPGSHSLKLLRLGSYGPGTNGPRNERSRERMFQRTNSLENESSREQIVLRTNVPGNEWSRERKFHHGNECSRERIVLRTNVPDTISI